MNWFHFADTLAAGLVVSLAAMILLWLLSLRLRDASIVDIWWGPGFALIAWTVYLMTHAQSPRALLVALLATVWGLRLGLTLFRRKKGHGEDRRYAAQRARVKGSVALWSLKSVFLLQGVVMWLVSLPLQIAIFQREPALLGPLGWIGAVLWLVGFLFEAVGDAQMDAFRADPANKGKVMDRGLWAWTRHPNYFGDTCVWIGFALIACDQPSGLIGLISPLAMGYFLVKVTGVPLLERYLMKRPGYAEYADRTPAFLPRPPRR
jgi:steroid 5-alpha reductase family enzyme